MFADIRTAPVRPPSPARGNTGTNVNIRPTDVYELAASLRQEFDRLMQMYGVDVISQLVPKTVNVLELLEQLSDAGQQKNIELEQMNELVNRLKADNALHTAQRDRYEKDMEAVEESWKNEMRELTSYARRLQEEKEKLLSLIREQDQDNQNSEQLDAPSTAMLMEHVDKLRSEFLKQCDELRVVRHTLDEKNSEVDALQSQVDRLLKLNADCWQRNALTQQHVDCLLREIVDLQMLTRDKEHQINKMKKRFSSGTASNGPCDDVDGSATSGTLLDNSKTTDVDVAIGSDLDCPRFTFDEFRGVLDERNKLKIRLYEMEEELERLRATDCGALEVRAEVCDLRSFGDNSDLPVEGPINKEPIEKLNPGKKKSSSIIRHMLSRKKVWRIFDVAEMNDGKKVKK